MSLAWLPISPFTAVSLAGWLTVVVTARVLRGRLYATFAGVFLGVHTLIALGVAPLYPATLLPIVLYLQAATFLHFLSLARPRMRSFAYRALVSVPASFFLAGTWMAFPWAIASAFGLKLPLLAIPYGIAVLGVIQSLVTSETEIDLVLDDAHVDGLKPYEVPHPHRRPVREERPLRIVQISDPHLGPFMPVARLRRICERAVERAPDLVLLTGDFLTMESQNDVKHLRDALAPLAALRGKVFACMGNHDHEAPELVKRALAENHVTLLIDESVEVETEAGPVQILGLDFHFRDKKARIEAACAANPPKPGLFRLVLLHDPWAFRHLPEGEGELVLSGHTHGGQVGLLSVGLRWTFLRFFGRELPDHGLWARGRDRLYVHRGTGHYGFPVRLGVPSEESVLVVHRARERADLRA